MDKILSLIIGGLAIKTLLDWQDLRSRGLRATAAAKKMGWVVTSNVRTLEKNSQVGGHPKSKHLVGLAWDFAHPRRPAQEQLTQTFTDQGLSVRTINEGDHIHVQIQGVS